MPKINIDSIFLKLRAMAGQIQPGIKPQLWTAKLFYKWGLI